MVNSFILYREWLLPCDTTKAELRKVTQTEFRTQVIKQMIAKSGDKITPPCIPKCTSAPGLEIQRLTGRHFIQKIIVDRQKTCISQSCKVCVPAEREEDKRSGVEPKHTGHESSYVYFHPCFYIYHNYKDYIGKYIEMKKTVVICFY